MRSTSAAGRSGFLTMPRTLGYGFNPLSVYFCADPDGALAAIIYEVHNTFGERHSYVLPVEELGAPSGRVAPRRFSSVRSCRCDCATSSI